MRVTHFTEYVGTTTFLYPVFKFLSKRHADAMITDGNFYLPPLKSFQDSSAHGGLIHDAGEGQLILGGDLFDASHLHAYCLTQHLLSNSFEWAIGEKGKNSCVAILMVDEFLRRTTAASARNGLALLDVRPCHYVVNDRRILELAPGQERAEKAFLGHNPHVAAFVKPKKYEAQREVRVVWQPIPDRPINPSISVPEIRDVLLPIEFDSIDASQYLAGSSPAGAVGCRIILKTGQRGPEYEIAHPREVLTPILMSREGGDWQLGFWGLDLRSFGSIKINYAETGIHFVEGNKGIWGAVPLSQVDHVELYTP